MMLAKASDNGSDRTGYSFRLILISAYALNVALLASHVGVCALQDPDGVSRLGELHGQGGWAGSAKKGEDAPGSPRVVAPGLNGSRRGAWFRMAGYNDPGNTSAQRAFPATSGERLVVEMTIKPSSDLRTIGIAVRSGTEASAYIRFNGKKRGWCQHYDDQGVYRDIAPFEVNAENRLKIELNTRTRKVKAWVNGAGGDEWPFRSSDVVSVDRIDLFMTHGNGPEVFAVVDDISVRDDEGKVVFAEDFENYFRADTAREKAASGGGVRVSPAPFKGDAALHPKVVTSEDPHLPQAGPKVKVAEGEDPDIAVSRDGMIHIVYVRGSKTFYRRGGLKRKWEAEVEIGSGVDPSIALGPDGKPHVAVTSNYDGLGGGKISYSRRDEKGFSPLRVVAEGACRKPRIRVDSKGNAVIAFEDRSTVKQRVRCLSVTPAGLVSAITVVGDQDIGGLVVDDRGTRHFTWRPKPGLRLQYTTMAMNGHVSEPQPISSPASDFSDIALHPFDRSVHVVGEVAGAGGIFYILKTPAGQWQEAQTFKIPEATQVEDADLVNPAVAVDAAGRRYITFTGAGMLPYFLVLDKRGQAGHVQRVDPASGPTGGKYMNPHLAAAPGGGAIVVWGSQGAVYLTKIT